MKAGYIDNQVFHNTKKGTPQGGIISPLLSNIALNGMEKILNITYYEETRKDGYVSYMTKGTYRMVRYADDFVIFAQKKEDVEALYDILNPYLNDRGLTHIKGKDKDNPLLVKVLIFWDLTSEDTKLKMDTNILVSHQRKVLKDLNLK